MRGNEATLTKEQWARVLEVYGHRCAYCRCEGRALTVDHIEPVIHGGSHAAENVVPACLSCNSRKNDSSLDVALARFGVNAFRWKAHRRLVRALVSSSTAV